MQRDHPLKFQQIHHPSLRSRPTGPCSQASTRTSLSNRGSRGSNSPPRLIFPKGEITTPSMLLRDNGHSNGNSTGNGKINHMGSGSGSGSSTYRPGSSSSSTTMKKYYIEFPNRLQVLGPLDLELEPPLRLRGCSSSSSINSINSLSKKKRLRDVDEQEEKEKEDCDSLLKEWMWNNCKEKILAAMIVGQVAETPALTPILTSTTLPKEITATTSTNPPTPAEEGEGEVALVSDYSEKEEEKEETPIDVQELGEVIHFDPVTCVESSSPTREEDQHQQQHHQPQRQQHMVQSPVDTTATTEAPPPATQGHCPHSTSHSPPTPSMAQPPQSPSEEQEETKKRLDLMDAIITVQRQFVHSESASVVFGCMLDCLLRLTKSEYGFINEVKYEQDGTVYLSSQAITDNSWSASTKKFFHDNAFSGIRFYNMETLFGQVVTTQQPVISNNPKDDPRGSGIPPGHPPMDSFLGLPFFKRGPSGQMEVSGVVGIANKPGGYSSADVDFLDPFTVTCSYLVQAYWQIRENKNLINTLEDKVHERTMELECANARLEDANKRALTASALQLQHFACMSHEIRTPLNCVIGMSSVLQQEAALQLSPLQQESLRMIVSSGDLLLAVVNDVMDYAKLETGHVDIELRKSNLQETLDSVVHAIQLRAAARNVKLQTVYGMSVPQFLKTDSRRLQQVLYNLLGNAIKFSKQDPAGSTVELRVTVASVPVETDSATVNHDMTSNNGEPSTSTSAFAVSPRSIVPKSHGHLHPHREEEGGDNDGVATTRKTHTHVGDVRYAEQYRLVSPIKHQTSICPIQRALARMEDTKLPSSTPTQQALAMQEDGQKKQSPVNESRADLSAPLPVSCPMNQHHQHHQPEPPKAETTAVPQSHKQVLRFVVKDFGKGIEQKDFGMIFQPFRQASTEKDQLFGGTGLGLAITEKLVHGLGGTITVDSQVGEWSEFTVDLPLLDPQASKNSKPKPGHTSTPYNTAANVSAISKQLNEKATIVLIDNEGEHQQQVHDIFQRYDVPLKTLSSMAEIVNKQEQFHTGRSRNAALVLLVQEDLYSQSLYDQILQKALNNSSAVLITFGPNFSAKDSTVHFRSLAQVLPSVLMKSIGDTVAAALPKKRESFSVADLMPTVQSASRSAPTLMNAIPFPELRVLIAEDNMINQKVLLRILTRLGLVHVDVVDNGKKAVEKEASKEYDVVLMDMQMPIMGGLEACEIISRRQPSDVTSHPPAKVIFVTAHVAASFVAECERAGGAGYIPKPFNIREIEKCLQNLMQDVFYYDVISNNNDESGSSLPSM